MVLIKGRFEIQCHLVKKNVSHKKLWLSFILSDKKVKISYDCLNHIYWNIHIDTATKKREPDALKDMIIEHIHPVKSIITADRGYAGYDLITCCNRNAQKFVFQVKDKNSNTSILQNCDLPNGEFDKRIHKGKINSLAMI